MTVAHPKDKAKILVNHIDWKTNNIATKERIVEWLDRLINEIYKDSESYKEYLIEVKKEYLIIK